MIYIRTCAYNAEKTLKRAVDSVMNQTYQDFEYHILDNGSQDRTGEMIRAYAQQDKRIVPYYNKVNRAFHENPDFWNLSRHIPENDYFCILDADDAYAPTFFEEMLCFMEENQLNMAACGTVFLDGKTGSSMGGRVLEQSIVVDAPEKLDAYFPMLHWNLRQVWGKLYRSKAAAARYELDVPDWFPSAYGGDTINTMSSAKAAGCFGVYAKALHSYTISRKSVSHQWMYGREESDVILHEKAVEFLEQTCGTVSKQNLDFLYVVYFHAIADTLHVLYRAQLPLADKLMILCRIWAHPITQEMFSTDLKYMGLPEENKIELLRGNLNWLERQTCAGKEMSLLQAFYTQLNSDFPKLISEEQLAWYRKKAPGLVSLLAGRDYRSAMAQLSRLLAAGGIPQNQTTPVLLAQNLSALLNREDDYIRYSKLLIEVLVREKAYQQAETELAQWEQILPGDEDLRRFRALLPAKFSGGAR